MKILLLFISILLVSCSTYNLNGESARAHNCRISANGYYTATSNMSSYDKAMYSSRNGYSSLGNIISSENHTCLDSVRVK